MTDMPELKECPFCGGKIMFYRSMKKWDLPFKDEGMDYLAAHCVHACFTTYPLSVADPSCSVENLKKTIINKLSRRAALSAPVAQVDVEKLREGALQAAADIHGGFLNASKTLTVRAALNYVFDHLTPKTQSEE